MSRRLIYVPTTQVPAYSSTKSVSQGSVRNHPGRPAMRAGSPSVHRAMNGMAINNKRGGPLLSPPDQSCSTCSNPW